MGNRPMLVCAMTIFQRWLAAFAACAIFCLVSISLFDRAIAGVAARLVQGQALILLGDVLDILVAPAPFCAAAVVWCGVAALRGRPVWRFLEVLSLAGYSATWTAAVNELMLKPLFGRLNIYEFFQHGRYGFMPFQGTIESAFPSGHASLFISMLSVFWMLYPRGRAGYAVVATLALPALLTAGGHFLSDVAAGVFVGGTAGLMTVTLWSGRPQSG